MEKDFCNKICQQRTLALQKMIEEPFAPRPDENVASRVAVQVILCDVSRVAPLSHFPVPRSFSNLVRTAEHAWLSRQRSGTMMNRRATGEVLAKKVPSGI